MKASAVISVGKMIDDVWLRATHSEDQATRLAAIRDRANELGAAIFANCPASRERALAITNLQQAIMWASVSIVVDPEGAIPS